MVERDRRQDGGQRLVDHVGRVQPAAKAGLKQHNVGRVLGERQEGRRRRDLEEGDRLAGVRGFGPAQDIHQMPLADGTGAARTRQHDALVEAAQVGRNKAVRPVARRLQHRLQESDRRALAVGARHMNDGRQPPVRIAERGQQPLDASQGKIDDLRVELFEARKKALGFFLLQMRRPKFKAEAVHGRRAPCNSIIAEDD